MQRGHFKRKSHKRTTQGKPKTNSVPICCDGVIIKPFRKVKKKENYMLVMKKVTREEKREEKVFSCLFS